MQLSPQGRVARGIPEPTRWAGSGSRGQACPPYGLKDFLDRAFYPTQDQVTGNPYAAFLTHGGGGNAIQSIESVAQSFKLKKAADPVLVKGRRDAEAAGLLKALGAKLAASAG